MVKIINNKQKKRRISKAINQYFYYLDKNLIQYQIDFTSVEYISKSDASSFTYGNHPNIFNVQKKDIGNNLVTFLPIDNQQENCLWDLNQCSTGRIQEKKHISLK